VIREFDAQASCARGNEWRAGVRHRPSLRFL